ncbi:MAG: vitamin K epoxide reductase family protein [Bacteroides sp.]|nr:vitamin K epoxide reductase family protein [Bacteroides sp.]
MFNERWNGIVMLPHPNSSSIERNYPAHLRTDKQNRLKQIGIYIGISVLFLILLSNIHITLTIGVLLLINVMGIYCAFLLLQKQLHIPNKIADKLCGFAKESHCENVTESDGATILGLVKLSEVGFGFFSN